MDRRDFLKGVGTVAATEVVLLTIPPKMLAATVPATTVVQGLTTETTTQLAVTVPKTASIQYVLVDKDTGKIFASDWIRTLANSKNKFRVDKIFYSGLELGHTYTFTVLDKNKRIDERFLKTVDINKINPRIALLSCMNADKSARTKMWASVQAADPDYIFLMGDNVYGDSIFSNSPDTLWSKYVGGRQAIPFYQWKNLKPVIATWDDHDFGKNDADGTYKYKDNSLAVFKAFYGQEALDTVLIPGPGNSNYFRAFNQNFLFLDSRFYRNLSHNGIKGFLGDLQLAWLSEVMQRANGEPTWIIEGSPFYGRAKKRNTSYQSSAPEEMSLFLKEVSSWNSPALFIAGDLHYSEISQIPKEALGYNTCEFISSSLHSSINKKPYDNPNPLLQAVYKENFLLFEKLEDPLDPTWNVTSIGAGSAIYFTNKFRVD